MSFRFIDPGPLIDGELELVAPHERWVDGMVAAAGHPLTRAVSPRDAEVGREQFARYVREFPGGRHAPDETRGLVPAYAFWMRLRPVFGFDPPVPMAGGVSLRIGHTHNLETYLGHVGYSVYPAARGRRLAERAVRLILPLARRHGVDPVWITCNPENVASRRTCERLGGLLVDVVPLPAGHPLYDRGERHKCRYRIDVGRALRMAR
ncbi:MAG: GNAT family N-acetyltransferase [Phycisphaerae bacterium]|nr:GNAT family N-acetyltransferase [Tepidisphaeraceae bacterium]